MDGRKGCPHQTPRLRRALEYLHNQGETVDISTRETPLDAMFWLCCADRHARYLLLPTCPSAQAQKENWASQAAEKPNAFEGYDL